MLLDQRRDEILQLIEKQGFVALQELVERLGASESTVRRDLEYLDGIGQIRRTRGGAAYTGEHLTPFEERGTTALPQKQRIARAVAEQIEPGETVLLDGGTTTLEVARCLANKPLQVVTNSLPIANLLVNQTNIELILIGGYLYPRTGVALGSLAAAALNDLHVGRVIMSAGGITEKGLFNSKHAAGRVRTPDAAGRAGSVGRRRQLQVRTLGIGALVSAVVRAADVCGWRTAGEMETRRAGCGSGTDGCSMKEAQG